MNRIDLFQNELNMIKSDDIREFAKILINDAPEYFFHVPASSTGKYHPSYALGEGGLARHTKAVMRFFNHIIRLEQYSRVLDERQIDLGLVACLAHDMQKSGTESYYLTKIEDGEKVFTVFDHPILAANFISAHQDCGLNEDEITYIADAVKSHMGQWNTDKRSDIVLPKPKSFIETMVHLADYLASRKDIEVQFSDEEKMIDLPDINMYKCPFKKHKGELLVDVAQNDPEYLEWLNDNVTLKEPMKTFIKKLLQKDT